MRFNCNVDGIEFTIELLEKKALKSSNFFQKPVKSVFDIYITSSKGGVEMVHVSQNHVFKNNRTYLESNVPDYIEERELIEHVLHHWELESKKDPNKPDWAKA
ncbi:MAG: hypothetical protein EP326_14080 [Deltaproteobacteria bacterium]|nr:MAG: hypothetical protein EP326_14080 [Deltaproteobacteria bacterium]TNF26463.1 MAG: hypothetical protein EP319_13830 [Deltaproteobacteria bacterium]